nr:hypothetical protein [Mesorhizobium sp. B2-9-1]
MIVIVDLGDEASRAAFLKVSPTGKMPALMTRSAQPCRRRLEASGQSASLWVFVLCMSLPQNRFTLLSGMH